MKAKEEMMYWIEKEHPELLDKMKKEEYEEEYGEHYNDTYALDAVQKMWHKSSTGEKVDGELVSYDKAEAAYNQYHSELDKDDTIWDLYVALNEYAHELGENYHKHAPTNGDAWMIEDAIHFWFGDENAPYGKIWHYKNAMDV